MKDIFQSIAHKEKLGSLPLITLIWSVVSHSRAVDVGLWPNENVPSTISLKEAQDLEEKIEEVCWLVCRKRYFKKGNVHLTNVSVYHLFRIFCFLSDLVPVQSSPNSFQVVIDSSEASKLVSDLGISLGLEWGEDEFDVLNSVTTSFGFPLFLAFIEGRFRKSVDSEPLQEAIAELYHTLTRDVIKKGTLLKKGYLFPTLREYWFVLETTELCYYKTRHEKNACGCISLNPQSRVDAPHHSGKEKVHKILIHSLDRTLELVAFDHRTKLQWVSALQLAITNSGRRESYQRVLVARRKAHREAGTLKMKEEVMKITSQTREIESTKEKLKKEIEARAAADQKAKKLQDSLEEQLLKERELIDAKDKLVKLLEEETQSKRDEEIVRNLQARVLREEWEKREELEKLQEEQNKMLEEEREKRAEFEKQQLQKEELLKRAQERLKALEEERVTLDKELHLARNKIFQSEKLREKLEAEIRMISSHIRDPDRVRRAMSFIGTTQQDREFLGMRAKKP